MRKTDTKFNIFQKLKTVTNELNKSAEETKVLFENQSIDNAILSIKRKIDE